MNFKIPYHTSIKRDGMKRILIECFESQSLSGDGRYTDRVLKKIKTQINVENVLMTTSGTQGLNMACRLADFREGDEVIMPAFAYTSCANSILLTGAKPVFCDVDINLNADSLSVERLINDRTKGIMIIHYGGVPCDMDAFLRLKEKYNLVLIEDAAHAYGSKLEGKALGTFGDYGIYSFHQTKNLTSGEGGALIIKDKETFTRACVYHQKGSDRYAFVKGDVPFYQWYGVGESCSPSDLLMALLDMQLNFLMEDVEKRKKIAMEYDKTIAAYAKENVIGHTGYCDEFNNHLYYIQYKGIDSAEKFLTFMQDKGIDVRTHYIPLHKTAFGSKFKREITNRQTDDLGRTVIRLPIHFNMSDGDIEYVCEALRDGLEYCRSCI